MSGSRGLERAEAEVRIARARLSATVAELQERLNPKALAHDAWTGIRERGDQAADDALDLVRSRPGAAAGVVAAVAVFLLRQPLGRAAANLFSQWRETEPAADKLSDVKTAVPRRRRGPTAGKGD